MRVRVYSGGAFRTTPHHECFLHALALLKLFCSQSGRHALSVLGAYARRSGACSFRVIAVLLGGQENFTVGVLGVPYYVAPVCSAPLLEDLGVGLLGEVVKFINSCPRHPA